MTSTQEMLKLRNSLSSILENLSTFNTRIRNEEVPLIEDDADIEDDDVVATIGDIVEVVVNPDTPASEVIEGELVGVLEDEEVMDDDGDVIDDERIVLVRTGNGRIRKAKIAKSVKIKNARKPSKLSVKTGNAKEGIDAMRTGDAYKPPVDDGLKITKNRHGSYKELRQSTRTNNEDIDIPEDEAQKLVDAVQELAAVIEAKFGEDDSIESESGEIVATESCMDNKRIIPSRQVRIKNFREVKKADGSVEVIVNGAELLRAANAVNHMASVKNACSGKKCENEEDCESENCEIKNVRTDYSTNNSSGDKVIDAMLTLTNLSSSPFRAAAESRYYQVPEGEAYNMSPPVLDFLK
jgi:hypothetical protein